VRVIPAALRRELGTDRTAASEGLVNYSDLNKTDHEHALVDELHKRGYQDRTIQHGWKKNLNVLKQDEGNWESFEPQIEDSDRFREFFSKKTPQLKSEVYD